MPVAIPLLAAATIGSGVLGYMGANSAANKQAQAAQQALAFQQQVYANNQTNLKPFIDTGTGATNTLSSMYGFPGGGNTSGTQDYSAFYNSPDYNFAQQQGLRAVDMSAASKGLLSSGGQARAIQTFGQGLASQQFGNYFNRMLSLSQLGQSAASSLAGNNNQSAGQIGQSYGNIGTAQASGIVGGTNAITGAANNGVNNLMLYTALNKSPSSYGSVGTPMNITAPTVGAPNLTPSSSGGLY